MDDVTSYENLKVSSHGGGRQYFVVNVYYIKVVHPTFAVKPQLF